LTPAGDKYPVLKWPLVRGVAAFVGSLVTGMKLITQSAEMAGLDEMEESEEPGAVDRFLEKHFGEKSLEYLVFVSAAVAVVFSVLIFMLLPTWLAGFIRPLLADHAWAVGIVEGLLRILILTGYMLLIGRNKDIRRVFQYHGAEHKTINCHESGQPLTAESIRSHNRLHKRCGTSFLLIVALISMVVFIFVRTDVIWARFLLRIVFVPLIAGASYEVIRWAGRHEGRLVDVLSFPGMMLQKISTSEPDDQQIEVAVAALEEVLANEPPDPQ